MKAAMCVMLCLVCGCQTVVLVNNVPSILYDERAEVAISYANIVDDSAMFRLNENVHIRADRIHGVWEISRILRNGPVYYEEAERTYTQTITCEGIVVEHRFYHCAGGEGFILLSEANGQAQAFGTQLADIFNAATEVPDDTFAETPRARIFLFVLVNTQDNEGVYVYKRRVDEPYVQGSLVQTFDEVLPLTQLWAPDEASIQQLENTTRKDN